MLQNVDLNDNKNLFVVSVILIAGVGGMTLNFFNHNGELVVKVTEVACALILGILVNLVVNCKKKKEINNIENNSSHENDSFNN